MSLTDEELREERKRPVFKGDRYVVVTTGDVDRIEKRGICVEKDDGTMEVFKVEEATALRDGLTVVIDQYHDFIARRDTKTNQEIIDEMEPGTVFSFDWHEGRFDWHGGESIYTKANNGKVFSYRSETFLNTSSFLNEATITVVNQ